jgi:hypothetical protein
MTVEIFDPVSNSFTSPPNFPELHYGAKVLLLNDRNLLLLDKNAVYKYNPYQDSYKSLGNLGGFLIGRWGFGATVLPNGKVLITGGLIGETLWIKATSDTIILDPQTGEYKKGPNLKNKRSEHISLLLPNGQVLIAGGDARNRPLSSIELYLFKEKK